MQNKNKKISQSLKKYHRRKRSRDDSRMVAGLIVFIVFFAVIVKAVMPTPLASAEERQNFLPYNEDKINPTIIDKILIIINEEKAWDISSEIICTLYEESIKTCKNPELCVNAYGNKPYGSYDRGIAMYSSYWRKDISDECAFSIDCSVRQIIKDFRLGRMYEWIAYCKK